MLYSTREASEASGFSVDTVRYYCKIGLVPRVMRDENNYRVFDEHDIAWLRGLRCLRECGMGIDQMREYMELCLEGEGSIPQRKDILHNQRRVVEDKITSLRDMLAFIDSKLSYYDKVRAGEISNTNLACSPRSKTIKAFV